MWDRRRTKDDFFRQLASLAPSVRHLDDERRGRTAKKGEGGEGRRRAKGTRTTKEGGRRRQWGQAQCRAGRCAPDERYKDRLFSLTTSPFPPASLFRQTLIFTLQPSAQALSSRTLLQYPQARPCFTPHLRSSRQDTVNLSKLPPAVTPCHLQVTDFVVLSSTT